METEKRTFLIKKCEYEEVELLKKSDRSSVFVVRKKENGKRFLLRVTEEKAEIFKNLQGVSCKNLPEIMDVYEDGTQTFVVEEYIPGETVFEVLRYGIFSEKEAEKCVKQVCKALSVLHEHGIVHRDIKPENIILSGERTVLIDFDASRKIDPEKTNDTKILGTTGYASPEQYGLSQTDERSDIYSLGVVLNIMLTGEHPSVKLAEGVLGKIVQKCTMINPDRRFQNAEELENALCKAEKQKQRALLKVLSGFISVFLLLGIFMSTERNIPEENPEEPENVFEEIPQKEEPVQENPENVIINNGLAAEGKSSLLPKDFYDYWSKDEIITENVELWFPGNLGEYITYEFSEDVWTFTIGNISAEEWKKAFEECAGEGTDVSARIAISAPNENVVGLVSKKGNGPTYSNLKNQHSNGTEFLFNYFDPETEKDWTGHELVKIIDDEKGFWAIPFQRNSIFYTVFLWREADGTEIWRIFPFQFVLGKDCEAAFFESDVTLPEIADISKENIWIDGLWEPITDSDRIVFKTVFEETIYREKTYLSENGVDVEIFEKPGYINTSLNSEADPKKVAFMEFFVLPPDASERKVNENLNNWIKRVYEETEFVGYKLSQFTLSVYSNPHSAEEEMRGVEAGRFFNIDDKRTLSLLLLPMYSAKNEEKTVWGMQDMGNYSAMVINWYKEDPNENPNAEPEVFEYVYSHYESAVIVK